MCAKWSYLSARPAWCWENSYRQHLSTQKKKQQIVLSRYFEPGQQAAGTPAVALLRGLIDAVCSAFPIVGTVWWFPRQHKHNKAPP